MASDKVSLSSEELPIKEIEYYFLSAEKALRSFYDKNNSYFVGYTHKQLQEELESRIEELNKSTAFTVLAAIEAHLKVDFLQRCYNKEKDELSKKLRELYKTNGARRVRLDDILEIWKEHVSKQSVISEIRSALNYRHWLAHGRYWVAKLGRKKYDFGSVLMLAIDTQQVTNIDMGA